jgi:putative tryptophan/tyrosine transport system substrate-binding protein
MITLSRRQIVRGAGAVGLALVAGCGRLPGQAEERRRVPSIGVLGTTTATPAVTEAFLQGLRDHGYVPGQNISIEYRRTEPQAARPSDLAAELIALSVDVLVVTAGTPAAQALRERTDTLPIVVLAGDLVGTGLVASLARPGGNVTGVDTLSTALGAKRLELLREINPSISRVAVMWNVANPGKAREFRETQAAAQALHLQLLSLEVRGPEDIESVLATVDPTQVGALVVLGDPLTNAHRGVITEAVTRNGLPSMFETGDLLDAGGLMAYGPKRFALYRRLGYYIDRILKGTKPADLPVEQPREFDFVVNLKTAQVLGLTIPHHVLLQATEVIQ